MTTRLAARIGLAIHAIFIAAIVVLANLGALPAVFSFVNSIPLGDKIGHFVLMGMLALLADVALDRKNVLVHIPLGPAIVLALVAIEELTQLAMPSTRTPDILDFSADVLGIAVFVAIGRLVTASTRRTDAPRNS